MINLSGKNLKGRDLSGFDLRMADLSLADLSYANLENANLEGADLTEAILYKTNLFNCRAREAKFKNIHFKYCNMDGSIMEKADFRNSSFSHSLANNSDFSFCNFEDSGFYASSFVNSNFCYANMTNVRSDESNLNAANFRGAVLNGADFGTSNILHTLFDCNSESEKYRFGKILDEPIIGYKKAVKEVIEKTNDGSNVIFLAEVLVTLNIPQGAVVFGVNGDKLRTNEAMVIKVEWLTQIDKYFQVTAKDEKERKMIDIVQKRPARSFYDRNFFYIEGKEVKVEDFDLMYNEVCGRGIHFFLTKKEAIDYKY